MYDTLIIGSGPAGMTAGLYAARANLKVGIIEQGAPGGQMNNTSEIENYPGYDHISGPELSMKMHAPLEKFGVENIYGIVKSIEDAGDVNASSLKMLLMKLRQLFWRLVLKTVPWRSW